MRRYVALFAAFIMLLTANCITASADTVVSDVFGADTVRYDVNIDGGLDIIDLIRLKKYAAGERVEINLNITGKNGDSLSVALVEIKKELLGVKR